METWYRVEDWAERMDQIEEIDVVRTTAKQIVTVYKGRESRTPKVSLWRRHFPSRQEAIEFVRGNLKTRAEIFAASLEQRIQGMRNEAQEAQDKFEAFEREAKGA